MQWHMFKRDYEIARTHVLIPTAGYRYETICVYLETLMRLEVIETETRDGGIRQRTVQVSPNPYICPYCQFKYKTYSSVANAAAAIWQHCYNCSEDVLKGKDAGPTMPAFTMKIRDTINIMEAKMTATGGFDFEPNFEVIFGGLLQEVLEHRLQAFQDLVLYHKVSSKASHDGKGGKAFGINVCLWRLIANGQIFNQRYLHPWHNLEQLQQESTQCNALLDEWVADAKETSPWGTLIIRNNVDDFPAKTFSFSPNIGFGPGAAVLQCCIASSQESPNHFKFDAMALAPNMDLLMSCKDAERVAQTIAQWNSGKPRTDKMELIQPPGGNMPRNVGTPDWNTHVRKEAAMVFSYESFRHWTSTTTRCTEEQRRVDREFVVNILKATEDSLFTHMAILNTQMGANLRAYHFLRIKNSWE